jgi:hypothetical protein
MDIRKYVERCLIDEYAIKNLQSGYSLDINDLPETEIQNFLDLLFKNDPILQEAIKDRMQDLINQRISFVELQARYDSGLMPIHDKVTGEVTWSKRGIAC